MRTTVLSLIMLLAVLAAVPGRAEDSACGIAGNAYEVLLLSMGTAGQYCERPGLHHDVFTFDDTSDYLAVDALEHSLLGGYGTYRTHDLQFEAAYVAIDYPVVMYELTLEGFSVNGVLLAGVLEIVYSEFDFDPANFGFTPRETATAIFLGLLR